MKKYKLDFLLPTFDIDLSTIGYHVNGVFFLFAVFVNGEEEEKTTVHMEKVFVVM